MRPRVLPLATFRRPIAASQHDRREAVARALSHCPRRERVLLALLLFERLTPAEAADVLRVPATHIERAYAALLAQLHGALGGRTPRAGVPRFATPAARLRRAS